MNNKLSFLFEKFQNKFRARESRKFFRNCYSNQFDDVSVIASNCIGGVLCSDMGLKFNSPFVNCYFEPDHFLYLLENFDDCINDKPYFAKSGEYVTATINGVVMHFIHDKDPKIVQLAYERRISRIHHSKRFIIATDRDGWSELHMSRFASIKTAKCFFTSNPEWSNFEFSVFFPEYSDLKCVPDLILGRKFYKNNLIFKHFNSLSIEV
jgi:uncharacterized protein (DUF1919 family)